MPGETAVIAITTNSRYDAAMSRDAQVRRIVLDAEQAACQHVNPIATLSKLLAFGIASDADPYLLVDLLAERIAETVAIRVPPARQQEVAGGALAGAFGSPTPVWHDLTWRCCEEPRHVAIWAVDQHAVGTPAPTRPQRFDIARRNSFGVGSQSAPIRTPVIG